MTKRKKPPESGLTKITSFFGAVNSEAVSPATSSTIEATSPTPSKKPRSKKKSSRLPPSIDDGGDGDDDEILPASSIPLPPKLIPATKHPSSPSSSLLPRSIIYIPNVPSDIERITPTCCLPQDHQGSFLCYPVPAQKLDTWNPRATGKQDFATLRGNLLPYVRSYIHLVGFNPPRLSSDQQPILYLAPSLNTNLTVNVSQNSMKMLLRYVNLRLDVKTQTKELKPQPKEVRHQYFSRVRYIKRLATSAEDPQPPEGVHLEDDESAVIQEIRDLLPEMAREDGDLAYHVVVEPLTFFPAYCQLSSLYEQHGFPQFSVLPLRQSLVPSHVVIDTKILVTQIVGRSAGILGQMDDERLFAKTVRHPFVFVEI
ncbi:hypothetical protein DFS34DRAFT_682302 [Phlyctochytrium arcticum]|nr:hypothetical protein DFS34DRAFT_682302 [Phlyctochytrium arcticum]